VIELAVLLRCPVAEVRELADAELATLLDVLDEQARRHG